MFDYSSEEGFGEVSGVTRGEGILSDEKKIDFHFQSQIKVLENHDALLFWDKNYENNSSVYELNFSYTDFNTFSDVDSIIVTKDTFLILKAEELTRCNPCQINFIDKSQRYNQTKIKIHKEKNLPGEIKLLDSLINKEIDIDLITYAKSEWLIKNQYFENGLSLKNSLASKNSYYSKELINIIQKLKTSSKANKR